MHTLTTFDVAAAWIGLKWTAERLVQKPRKGEPLEVKNAPKAPGLYRITWDGVDDWVGLPEHVDVKASRRIADPRLSIQGLQPPVLLTIGRTTNLRKRIRQHFGSNDNSNRLFMRMARLLVHLPADEIRRVAMRNLLVEWTQVSHWSHRCLLERYGSAVCKPLFDIDAEH